MNNIKKINAAILKNEDPYDHQPWIEACKKYNSKINYKLIDLTKNDWLETIKDFAPDLCLLKPSGKTSLFRTLYQERIDILAHDMGIATYPSLHELRIYENKRFFAYWAMANQVPHPKTSIFYNKSNALTWLKTCQFPVVAKLNIGASGNGVVILKNQNSAKQYTIKIFKEGIAPRTGPKLSKRKLTQRIWNKLTHPAQLINRLKTYAEIASDKQKGFVVFQKFIAHDYEWRAIRIGDSFFVHKKLKIGNMASGTLIKKYDTPPIKLLDFVKKLTDKFQFNSVAVDLFEDKNGNYLVNEIQCIFGQSDPYQMLVNNQPGRYIYVSNDWLFEKGDFNQNQSYNLRLKSLLETLSTK